jgi:3'(2'), 5'-bisphosphate nucleotidase
MNLHRERAVVGRLAREAGRAILDVYATDFTFEEKSDDAGPVTMADQRASDLIVRGLREAFPGDGIVSEEAEPPDVTAYERCWYVDPLDGTKEFIARNGEFAVQIGLAIRGEARLGIVYRPVGERLYAGVIGEGCELESPEGRRDLRVGNESDPARLRILTSRSHSTPAADAIIQALGATSALPCGSVGVKVGLIAEQVADAYFLTSLGSHLWDACAPEAVLRSAGGICTDLDGRPFRYDVNDTRNRRGLLACNAASAPAVLEAIDRVLRATPLGR